jgi:peptide/nickel transport system permease protein
VLKFVIKRLLYGILVLWGVVTLVFSIFSINPGDPAKMLLGQRVDKESLAAVNRELGLDLPWHKQYLLYLNDLSPVSLHTKDAESRAYFDESKYNGVALFSISEKVLVFKQPYLRRSFQSRKPVSEIISEAMPGTIILALFSIGFAVLFGIVFGVIAAVKKGTSLDDTLIFSAVLGMSTPSFFSAIIISWLGGYVWADQINIPAILIVFGLLGLLLSFGIRKKISLKRSFSYTLKGLGLGVLILIVDFITKAAFSFSFIPDAFSLSLPGTGLNMTGSLYSVDVFEGEYLSLQNLILPMITLGIRPLAVVIQLTRNAMLDVLSQDYIRTAKAKGLSRNVVLFKHALRNALNPVVTAVSGWFASMLAGAVFIEFIFNWKGLGLRVFQSLQNDDYPVIMGSVLVIAAIFVLINILVDIIYGIIDPRVRIT